jgi:hypothetical protein
LNYEQLSLVSTFHVWRGDYGAAQRRKEAQPQFLLSELDTSVQCRDADLYVVHLGQFAQHETVAQEISSRFLDGAKSPFHLLEVVHEFLYLLISQGDAQSSFHCLFPSTQWTFDDIVHDNLVDAIRAENVVAIQLADRVSVRFHTNRAFKRLVGV